MMWHKWKLYLIPVSFDVNLFMDGDNEKLFNFKLLSFSLIFQFPILTFQKNFCHRIALLLD